MIKYERIDVIKLAEMQCKLLGIDLIDYSEEEKEKGCKLLERYIQEMKIEIPSLIPVFNVFTLFPVKLPIDISTDYSRLFFNPKLIMEKMNPMQERVIKYQLMHIIIHGLLGDNELASREKKSKVLWLSLDQRVNDICLKLGFKPMDPQVSERIRFMKENKPYSLCFGNYYLSKNNKYLKKKASAAWKSIASDNHEFWYKPYVKRILGILYDEDDEIGGDGKGDNQRNQNLTKYKWDNVRKIFMEGDEDKAANFESSMIRKMDSDLQKGLRGIGAGTGDEIIQEAEGTPLDYKEIIKDLLQQLEDPREVPDSIDQMMYQFGLDMYGDVPLIEPKEGDEILKLNTICLAIDTSGSCSGNTVQVFLREIKELIRELKGSICAGKLILIQCDYKIQKEDIYEIDEFIDEDSKEIADFRGWGGTRFVPVFDRLDEVVDTEKISVDALIYLTDGYGDFPDESPNYPTIFVMPKEDAEMNDWIPDWVQVGVLED